VLEVNPWRRRSRTADPLAPLRAAAGEQAGSGALLRAIAADAEAARLLADFELDGERLAARLAVAAAVAGDGEAAERALASAAQRHDARPIHVLILLLTDHRSQADAVLRAAGMHPRDAIAFSEGEPPPPRGSDSLDDAELDRILTDERVRWVKLRRAEPYAFVDNVLAVAGDPALEPQITEYVTRTGGRRRDMDARAPWKRAEGAAETIGFYDWPHAPVTRSGRRRR